MITNLDKVEAFMLDLRDRGFEIGISQLVQTGTLLRTLDREEKQPSSWTELGRWIMPVVCSSRSEQTEFSECLQRWEQLHGPLESEPPRKKSKGKLSVPPGHEDVEIPRRAARKAVQTRKATILTALAGIVVLALLAIVISPVTGPDPIDSGTGEVKEDTEKGIKDTESTETTTKKVKIPPSETWTELLLSWVKPPDRLLLLSLFWATVLLIMLTLLGRQRVLERRFSARRPGAELMRFATRKAAVFAGNTIRRHFQTLRKHMAVPSRNLKMRATLNATLRNADVPTPIFADRLLIPDYLVVVGHHDVVDQNDDIAAQLSERFEEEQIHFERLDYYGNPTRLIRHESSELECIFLEDLAAFYPRHRLILIDDSAAFVDPESSLPAEWLSEFDDFDIRVLLSLTPVNEWGRGERNLEQAGFVILPLHAEGISRLAQLVSLGVNDNESLLSIRVDGEFPLPRSLSLAPERWLDDGPRDKRAVEKLLGDLETSLDPNTFEWLCALAVFPRIHPELTRHLGAELKDTHGIPVLTDSRYLALNRLPWVQRSYMPDWLRQSLVNELPPPREKVVREALSKVLLSWDQDRGGIALDIVPHSEDDFLQMLLRLTRRMPKDSPLREQIFLNFMHENRSLAFGAPEKLTDLLLGANRSPWWLMIPAVLVTLALWFIYPQQGFLPFLESLAVTDMLVAGFRRLILLLNGLALLTSVGAVGMWGYRALTPRTESPAASIDYILMFIVLVALLLASVVGVLGTPAIGEMARIYPIAGLPLLALLLRLYVPPPRRLQKAPLAMQLTHANLPWIPVSLLLGVVVLLCELFLVAVVNNVFSDYSSLVFEFSRSDTAPSSHWLTADSYVGLRAGLITFAVFAVLRPTLSLNWSDVFLIALAAIAGRVFGAFVAGLVTTWGAPEALRWWLSAGLGWGCAFGGMAISLAHARIASFSACLRVAGIVSLVLVPASMGIFVITSNGFEEWPDAFSIAIDGALVLLSVIVILLVLLAANRRVSGRPSIGGMVGGAFLVYFLTGFVQGAYLVMGVILGIFSLDNIASTSYLMASGAITAATLIGYRLVRVREVDAPVAKPDYAVPWLLLPLLFSLSLYVKLGDLRLDLSYLLLPLAAWLGHRYGRDGFRAIVFGGLPMIPSFSVGLPVRMDGSLDAYFFSLVICTIFWRPHLLFDRIARFNEKPLIYLLLFSLLPIYWDIFLANLGFRWNLWDLFFGGAFLIGLSSVRWQWFTAFLVGYTSIGMVLNLFELNRGGVGDFSIGFFLSHPSHFVYGIGMFGCGRLLQGALQGKRLESVSYLAVILNVAGLILALATMSFDSDFGSWRLFGFATLLAPFSSFTSGVLHGNRGVGFMMASGILIYGLILILPSEAQNFGLDQRLEIFNRDWLLGLEIILISVAASLIGSSLHTRLPELGNLYTRAWDAIPRASSVTRGETPAEAGYVTPWIVSPVVFLLPWTFYFGDFTLDLRYLILPVAAWMGSRYRRSGLLSLAIVLFPMLFFRASIDFMTYRGESDLYLTALVVAWACAYPDQWWPRVKSLDLSTTGLLALLIASNFSLGLQGGFGSLGWDAFGLLGTFIAFAIGISGKGMRPLIVASFGAALLGMVLVQFRIISYSFDLGNGLNYLARYRFDTTWDLINIVIAFALGRVLLDALGRPLEQMRYRWLYSWKGYAAFVGLWIFCVHWIELGTEFQRFGIAGSDDLLWVLTFVGGAIWRSKAVLPIAIGLALSYAEATVAYLIEVPELSIGQTLRLDLNLPDLGYHTPIFITACLLGIVGMQVANYFDSESGAINKSVLAPDSSPVKSIWQGILFRDYPSTITPWLFVPLMPLFALQTQWGRDIGVDLRYLAIPFAAWFAFRYGRSGFLALTLGMSVFWGGRFFLESFAFAPDLYIMVLLTAWVIANPGTWQSLLKVCSKISWKGILIILLVCWAVYFPSVQSDIGWNPGLLLMFMMLVLGWVGIPARLLIYLLIALGIVGKSIGLINQSNIPLDIFYAIQSVSDILALSLAYGAGRLVKWRVDWAARGAPENEDVKTSGDLYVLALMVLICSPFAVTMQLFEQTWKIWGSNWLPMFVSLSVGFAWQFRGVQLSGFAGVFVLLAMTVVLPNEFFSEFEIPFSLPSPGYTAACIAMPVWATLGMVISTAIEKPDEIGSGASPSIRPVKSYKSRILATLVGIPLIVITVTLIMRPSVYIPEQEINPDPLTQTEDCVRTPETRNAIYAAKLKNARARNLGFEWEEAAVIIEEAEQAYDECQNVRAKILANKAEDLAASAIAQQLEKDAISNQNEESN